MTRAVSDCLLDAISRLVYANQNHACEIRTRMTFEAVLNAEWYLLDGNLGINMPQLDNCPFPCRMLFTVCRNTGKRLQNHIQIKK